MKHITTLALAFLSLNLFGQYINGPANIRNKPSGKILFSINDYVKVDLNNDSILNDWQNIILSCKVNSNDLKNKITLNPNSTLYSFDGDSIGYTVKEFNVYENQNQNYWKYNELSMISVSLNGYTYKSNLRYELTKDEIQKNKQAYSDNFNSSYIQFKDENGITITEIEQCNFYNPYISIDGKLQSAVVKEIQKIKRTSGMEGQESRIDLEIVTNCFSDSPQKRSFNVEADKVDIFENIITTVKYGCCGAENKCQLFNIKSFKKLMDFDKILYHVKIPNSDVEGFIGFQFSHYDKNEKDIGIITFSSLDSMINKVRIITHNKNTFDNILRFVPEMEFEILNEKDQTDFKKSGLTLWSKNMSNFQKDISDFNFLIHFLDESTSKDLTQRLEFKNGFINGNPNKEFELIIE